MIKRENLIQYIIIITIVVIVPLFTFSANQNIEQVSTLVPDSTKPSSSATQITETVLESEGN